ncbi:MAG: hypothetical protein HY749_15830 [Gammaproteobacteria bacterium]|nr:hypothetical protein [Gammaproteobacteria bacterium]
MTRSRKKVTSTYLETLQPGTHNGEIVVDPGLRSQGALILRVTDTARAFYYRYFIEGRRRFELVGYFDPEGSKHWRADGLCYKGSALTLAAARDGFRELMHLSAAVGDLKAHYEAERRSEEEARRAAKAEAKVGTFGELLAAYVASLKAAGKTSAREVERAFARAVEAPFPHLVAQRADLIAPEDIRDILSKLVDRGVTRGVNATRSYLCAAFQYAPRADLDPRKFVKDGKKFGLRSNPVILVPRIAEFERVGERVLSAAEMRAYVGLISDPAIVKNPITRAALRMHVYTGGQRAIQLMAAKWSDYDTESEPAKKVVRLIDRKGRGQPRHHFVPLLEEAVTIIEEMKPITSGFNWPFATTEDAPIWHETLAKEVEAIRDMKRDDEPIFKSSFSLRDIRRTVETTLAELGISREHRAQLLSHGRGDPIAKAYDKYSYLKEKRFALETWRAFLHPLESPESNVVPIRSEVGEAS